MTIPAPPTAALADADGLDLHVPLPPGWLSVDLVSDDWEQDVRDAVTEHYAPPVEAAPALEHWLTGLRAARELGVLVAALLVEQDEPGAPAQVATVTVALGQGPLLPVPSAEELQEAASLTSAPEIGELRAVQVPLGRGWVQRGTEDLGRGTGASAHTITAMVELSTESHLVITGSTPSPGLYAPVERVVATMAHLSTSEPAPYDDGSGSAAEG